MKIKFDKDYYANGVSKGISCYENYRWIPELTYPLAHSIFSFLKLKKKNNVLEFGCAHGYLVKCLKDFGINAYGVDISEYAINNCPTDISDRVSVIKNDNLKNAIKKIKFKKKYFDWVISKDVLEHISPKHLRKLLIQISKISKNMLVVVPLGDNSIYRIKNYHLDKTHVVIKNEQWWINLFKKNGFETVKMHYKIEGIKDKWFKINNRGNGFFLLKSKYLL